MAFFQLRRARAAAFLLLATFAVVHVARAGTTSTAKGDGLPSLEALSLSELDDQLQVRFLTLLSLTLGIN
jgi:hypothetical protein